MAHLFTEAGEENGGGDCVLLSTAEVADQGVDVSAVDRSVVWGRDVLREWEAGPYSSGTPRLVVKSSADVGALGSGTNWVVAPTCTWFLCVAMAPSVEICGTTVSGRVGKSCFPVVVCTATGPTMRTAVLGSVLRLVTGCAVSGAVVVKPGDIFWAAFVFVARMVCLVEDSVKAEGKGDSEGEPIFTALLGSVGKDTRLGDLDCVVIWLWYGVLWFVGSAV